MGNCCSCLPSEVNPRSTIVPGNYSLTSGKVEDSGTVCYPSRLEESEDSSFIGTGNEPFVNGTGLESRESKGDPKRINNNTISSSMGNSASVVEVSEVKLLTFYENYYDSDEDIISAEGILRLCADLDLPADDFHILLFAWKCNAAQMGRLTKQEFLQGCRLLGADSAWSLKSVLEEMVKEVDDSENFNDMYSFAFRFALDVECGQRSLPVEVAISLWKLVFTRKLVPLLERWIKFLEQSPSPVRAIPRDTWHMFLHLVDAVGDDLSRYDDTEAWPSLFDDFVEWANDKANQNVNVHTKAELA